MAIYRIRALAHPNYPGFRRNGFYYPSGQWTDRDLTEAEAGLLMNEPRLIVEAGSAPKNQAKIEEGLAKLAADNEKLKAENASLFDELQRVSLESEDRRKRLDAIAPEGAGSPAQQAKAAGK